MNIITLLIFLATPSVWASVQKLVPSGGKVEMLAIGKPSFLKIQGQGAAPEGEFQIQGQNVIGRMEFDLQSLDTGIELRNDHMKNKYLQVSQYPTARLELKSVPVTSSWSVNSPKLEETEFSGDLTLHGQRRPAKGRFSIDDSGKVEAKMKIKLSDFQVEIPSYMGITVADEVEIKVQLDRLKVVP